MRLCRLAPAACRLQHRIGLQAMQQGLQIECADSALIGPYRRPMPAPRPIFDNP
jgi:hypothetical protein